MSIHLTHAMLNNSEMLDYVIYHEFYDKHDMQELTIIQSNMNGTPTKKLHYQFVDKFILVVFSSIC